MDQCAGREGPLPTVAGFYRVVIFGDRETDGMGGVIYEYDAFEMWAEFSFDPDEGTPLFQGQHTAEMEEVIAWFGPIDVPRYDCLKSTPDREI